MSWAKSPRILLVWPRFEKITLRAADLRILQQHASYLGAEMGVITRRGDVRRDAERFGIPVFGSAAAAQRDAWPKRDRLNSPSSGKPRRQRSKLEALREAAKAEEASWRSGPAARFGFFALGVLAVLAVAALFVPEAVVALTPISQGQSVTLPVTASKSIAAVSIAGGIPAHEITVTVSGTQSARVSTESSIPDSPASGIARFTNLTQSDVSIPAGTIVYSLSPAVVQFATMNNTHVAGNVNAVVEVPISAVNGGAAGNLPANSIQAVEGNLSLSLAVTNPEPTIGGTDRMTAAPSDADRQRLHDVLTDTLKDQAQGQISDSLAVGDILLVNTFKMGEIAEETYDPPAGKPGNLLKLTMRADFSGQYVKEEDLKQLAQGTLNASMPPGFGPAPNSMTLDLTDSPPTLDDTGASHFDVRVERKLVHDLDLQRASVMVRGRSPADAARVLQAGLALARPPEIKLKPDWWPWLPLIPFRITVVSNQ